jgi:GNAT superfamily N-acetyltransferase
VSSVPTDSGSGAGGTEGTGPAAIGPIPHEEWRDAAGRHYPAHLDAEELAHPERWWGAWWASTVARDRWPVDQVPRVTFDRSRRQRDERRERAARSALVAIRGGPCESAAGRPGWVWTAALTTHGVVVGEVRAHAFDADVDGVGWPVPSPVPAGAVVLDGVSVHPRWRWLGIGRRLLDALREEISEPVIVLVPASAGRGFFEACGFRMAHALHVSMWFFSEGAAAV